MSCTLFAAGQLFCSRNCNDLMESHFDYARQPHCKWTNDVKFGDKNASHNFCHNGRLLASPTLAIVRAHLIVNCLTSLLAQSSRQSSAALYYDKFQYAAQTLTFFLFPAVCTGTANELWWFSCSLAAFGFELFRLRVVARINELSAPDCNSGPSHPNAFAKGQNDNRVCRSSNEQKTQRRCLSCQFFWRIV